MVWMVSHTMNGMVCQTMPKWHGMVLGHHRWRRMVMTSYPGVQRYGWCSSQETRIGSKNQVFGDDQSLGYMREIVETDRGRNLGIRVV